VHDAGLDVLDAEHGGYNRLPEPVMHRRRITFEKRFGFWTIEDRFEGAGEHTFDIAFNFDTGIDPAVDRARRIVARGRNGSLGIVTLCDHAVEIVSEKRWVSRSYGTVSPASAMIVRLRATPPVQVTTLIVPFEHGDEARLDRIVKLNVRDMRSL
jgi:hypothetical protein